MAIPPDLALLPRVLSVDEPRSLPEPRGLHRLSIGPPVQSGSTPDLREIPDETLGADVSPSKWRRKQGDDRGRFSLSAALGATLGRSNSKRGRDGDRAKDSEQGRTARTPSVSPQVRRREASPGDNESLHVGAAAGPRSPGQPHQSNESERLGGDCDGPEGDQNAHQRGKAKTWMKTALKAITRYEGYQCKSCCHVYKRDSIVYIQCLHISLRSPSLSGNRSRTTSNSSPGTSPAPSRAPLPPAAQDEYVAWGVVPAGQSFGGHEHHGYGPHSFFRWSGGHVHLYLDDAKGHREVML